MPVSGESPIAFQPNSGVVVLPRITAPASRSRATAGPSSVSGTGSIIREPRRVGNPRISTRSLIVTGTPSSGPSGAPVAPALFRGTRRGQRAVAVDHAERVELRLQRLDPVQQRLGRLDRRQRLRAIQLDQVERRGKSDVATRSSCSLRDALRRTIGQSP